MSTESYWLGHAPNYSRAIEAASESVHAAKVALVDTMQKQFPLGTPVRVIHWRGEFVANVTGWDAEGCRILVRNAWTGKVSKWWAAHIEHIGGAA